jgi:hypothetical protein
MYQLAFPIFLKRTINTPQAPLVRKRAKVFSVHVYFTNLLTPIGYVAKKVYFASQRRDGDVRAQVHEKLCELAAIAPPVLQV